MLASYFLGLADLPLARELYDAAKRELAGTILGFGVIREYPRSSKGRGDIDSGPILFGKSISATGFMLACARQQRDRKTYESIFATAHLFGAPTTRNNRTTFVAGGPLGDAMMFALLTAIPPGSSLKRL